MNWRYAFFLLLIAFFVVNCSKTKEFIAPTSRTMQPSEISGFHPEISIQIGWVPYQNQHLILNGNNEWRIVPIEGERQGAVPTLLISYPESGDSILLDMNIENEMLGKLIKHSAMTQEPIKRPFHKFFEVAKCQKCHPPEIEVDFGR
jgi:hypothetical protein